MARPLPGLLAGVGAAAVRACYLTALAAASLTQSPTTPHTHAPSPSCRRCASSDHPKHCAGLTEVTMFYGLWYSAYAGVSAAVVRRSGRMRRLLNPFSSGFVNIQSV